VNIGIDHINRNPKVIIGLGFAAVAVAILIIPKFLNIVQTCGHFIQSDNIKLDYIIGLLWAFLLGCTILLWPVSPQDKKNLLIIWGVKVSVALGLMLLYENHYGLDSYGYFMWGKMSIDEIKALNLPKPNQIVIAISWLHSHCFIRSYHAIKISFGMIGLAAIYIYYRAAVAFLKKEKPVLLYILALFPSLLFWSSILGKEPLVMLGMSLYSYGVVKWGRTGGWHYLLPLFGGLVFTSLIRVWLGAMMMIAMLPVGFSFRVKSIRMKTIFIVLLVVLFLICAQLFVSHFGLGPDKKLADLAMEKVKDFAVGGSAGNVEALKFRNTWDMVCYVPAGMFTVLFRPLPGEVRNVFGFLAGLEGIVLVILFIVAMARLRPKELIDPLVIWVIILVTVWAVAYGFVGYNLGTTCRFRAQVLPIFLCLLLYQARAKDK